jgi:hypothetical protein
MKPPKQTCPQNVQVRSKIQCHFEVPMEIWRQFQHKLANRGVSASFFFREKISEFLRDELDYPLAGYREIYCNNCPYAEACKDDQTLETRCLLASLALSLSRLIKSGGA